VDIRNLIQNAVSSRTTIRKVNEQLFAGKLSRPQKIACRRMMSRYWDNHSAFALDLASAVIRQGSFVEKMHKIDWLHSPTISSTMSRLLLKYERFFTISE
jgi:hypothetical protein